MSEQASERTDKLYHERQVRELCALHALNNLLQSKQAFAKKDLDEICNRLSPGSLINPHRSMLGLGNYDVNVLMAALQQKGLETIWFDKRKDVDVLRPDNIMGFILNMPVDFKLGFVKFRRKHWIAIRWLQGQYMNLDSKLDAPAVIGDTDSLVTFLRSELSEGDKELFLVVEQDVYDMSSWRRESTSGEEGKQNGAQTNGGQTVPSSSLDSNKSNNTGGEGSGQDESAEKSSSLCNENSSIESSKEIIKNDNGT